MNLRYLALVASLLLGLTACGTAAVDEATGVVTVSPQAAFDAVENADDVVLLDIRTPEEIALGAVPDAVNIDFYAADFADQIAALDRDATYVVYCRSGNRSGQAAALFEQLGFDDVRNVEGGILAWADAGLPVEP